MPYIMRISSQKGGVGKTTVAVNLAVSLQRRGYRTLLIDADTTNPSIGFHLGMTNVNVGLKDITKKEAQLKDYISIHGPSGLHTICGTIDSKPFTLSEENAKVIYSKIKSANYAFIIVDTQPGYTTEYIAKVYDEALLITTPEAPAVASIIRLAHSFDKLHLKHHLVINKLGMHRYELHPKEIEEAYEGKAIGILPEDEIVPMSIAEHIPAVMLSKRAKFSQAAMALAETYSAMSDVEPQERFVKVSFWNRLWSLFRRSR
ncbi:MAG: AAA family ATPase [Candidatus Micrarchaeia archaeon]|jgi:flagellar biosynthesis protein FlhG